MFLVLFYIRFTSSDVVLMHMHTELWALHTVEQKKVTEVDVVLYNMAQLVFESNALPAVNAPLLQKESILAFDESISVAHPDAALGGINEIIESAHSTTKFYLNYVLITQAADFMDERTREFNSMMPFYTTGLWMSSYIMPPP